MKKMIFPILLLSWYSGKSQLVSFDFTGAAGNERTYSSKMNDPNLSPSQITRSAGMMRKPGAGTFNSSAWADQITPDPGKYIEFTVSPLPGKKATITGITCKHRRTIGGPLRFAVRTSIDSYTSDIANFMAEDNVNDQTTFLDLSAKNDLRNVSTAVTVRIYGYRAERASGEWGLGSAERDHLVLHGASGTLPVVISSFQSAVFKEHIQLKWVTESEHNSSFFNIYKSTDGISFTFKGRIKAAGFSSSTRKYTFDDYNPASGINYYQLVETDQNGEHYQFGTIPVKIELHSALSIMSSTKDVVELLIKSTQVSRGKIIISDVNGRQLAKAILLLSIGDNTVTLPLDARGVLLIARFESPEITISKKFIKN